MISFVQICLLALVSFGALVGAEDENIDTIDRLKTAMNDEQSDRSRKLVFYSTANALAVKSLFKDSYFTYDVVPDDAKIHQGVLDGTYLAASVAHVKDEDIDKFNVINSNIISPKAVFTLPDESDEHPYGAAADESRRQFRNALNLAVMRVQNDGIDYQIARKYQQTIADVRTCKLDKESVEAFVIPNKAEAQGLLGKLLRREKLLLVGWYQNINNDTDTSNQFNLEYLEAVLRQFAELSGPDGVKYGELEYQRVFANSSTANLLRGRAHMSGPYFVVDNVYRGSREPCQTPADCIKSPVDPNGQEACVQGVCTSQTRPISEVFKLSCFTYGSETLFLTRRIGQRNEKAGSSGGTIAGFVILSLCLVAALAFLGFVLFRERVGRPLLVQNIVQLEKMSVRNQNFNDDS